MKRALTVLVVTLAPSLGLAQLLQWGLFNAANPTTGPNRLDLGPVVETGSLTMNAGNWISEVIMPRADATLYCRATGYGTQQLGMQWLPSESWGSAEEPVYIAGSSTAALDQLRATCVAEGGMVQNPVVIATLPVVQRGVCHKFNGDQYVTSNIRAAKFTVRCNGFGPG